MFSVLQVGGGGLGMPVGWDDVVIPIGIPSAPIGEGDFDDLNGSG